MQTVQKESDKRTRQIQLKFTQFMVTNKGKQPTKDKRKETHKKQRVELAHADTKKQLTLNPVTRNGKRKITIEKQLIAKKQN